MSAMLKIRKRPVASSVTGIRTLVFTFSLQITIACPRPFIAGTGTRLYQLRKCLHELQIVLPQLVGCMPQDAYI